MSVSIETTFHDLINPSNSEYLDDSLPEFLQNIQINDDQITKVIALIGHKIQSPLELEAMTACHIIEFLVREGGNGIHKHIAMYKFLNDCIRVLSPKYLGKRTTTKVKHRVTELLFCWAEAMPHHVKLRDAYTMLKRNGIIKMDPKYNDRIMLKSVAKRDRPNYLDENRELLLKELLASKNPEDHAKANRLIQNMIKEDDEKVEKLAKRLETVDEANTASDEIIEILQQLSPGAKGFGLSQEDRDRVDQLYQACSRLRPTIFRMASEASTDGNVNETELTNILQVNDLLQKGISMFDNNVGEIQGTGRTSSGDNNGLDLLDLGDGNSSLIGNSSSSVNKIENDVLTNSLVDLGLEDLISTPTTQTNGLSAPVSNLPEITYTIDQLSMDAQKAATIYDKDGVRCIATPCQNKICVFSLMNTSNKPVSNFQLQIAVTNQVQVKIQDPDKTELPAFNPIMQQTINQIVCFTSSSNSIQIKFRMLYTHGGIAQQEMGEAKLLLN